MPLKFKMPAPACTAMLECVPAHLAADITAKLDIPVIGIGAGADTDAQVLVLHDMLGLSEKTAKFVRNFMEEASSVQGALKSVRRRGQIRVTTRSPSTSTAEAISRGSRHQSRLAQRSARPL